MLTSKTKLLTALQLKVGITSFELFLYLIIFLSNQSLPFQLFFNHEDLIFYFSKTHATQSQTSHWASRMKDSSSVNFQCLYPTFQTEIFNPNFIS